MFDKLLEGYRQIRDGIQAGNFRDIRKGLEAIIVAANSILDSFSGPGVLSTEDETKLAECEGILEELKATAAAPSAAPALGPGTILIIIELAMQLISWIRERRKPKT